LIETIMPWRSANLHEQLAQPLLCQLDIVHCALLLSAFQPRLPLLLSAFQPRLPLLLSAFQPRLPPPRHWLLSLVRPRPRPESTALATSWMQDLLHKLAQCTPACSTKAANATSTNT
jgi:hypothetical protein